MFLSQRGGERIKDCIALSWLSTTDRLLVLIKVIFGR